MNEPRVQQTQQKVTVFGFVALQLSLCVKYFCSEQSAAPSVVFSGIFTHCFTVLLTRHAFKTVTLFNTFRIPVESEWESECIYKDGLSQAVKLNLFHRLTL